MTRETRKMSFLTAATAMLLGASFATAQTPDPGTGQDAFVIEDWAAEDPETGEPTGDFGLFTFAAGGSGSSEGATGASTNEVRFDEETEQFTPWEFTPEGESAFVNELTLVDDPEESGGLTFGGAFSAAWNERHVANGGNPTGEQPGDGENVLYDSGNGGWFGFYVRTDDPDVIAAPAVDEFPTPSAGASTEVGPRQQIQGDGQWQLLQWNLGDDEQWDAFFGDGSNGELDTAAGTLDSINFWNTGPDDGETTVLELAYAAVDPDSPLEDFTAPDVLAGDLNGDGEVNNLDINPFVLALTDPTAFEQQFDVDPAAAGDINGDGQLNNLDINPFVSLLTGGSSLQAVPEPASAALLMLGASALMAGGRRNRKM